MAKYEDILEEIRKRTELANTNLNNAQDAINYGQNNGRSYESLDTQLKNSRAITRDYAADIKRIANKNNIAYSNTEELTPTLSSLASKNINKKAWEQDSKLPKNIVDIAKRNEKELQNEKKRFNETIGNTQEYKDYQYRINKLNPTLSYSRDVAELNEKGINGLDKTFAPLLSGLDNIKISNSFKQSDNSRVNLPTLNDLKTQKATENANWLYKGYADISQSIGNMLPGIAASAINPALGSALFFGNTYKNAVNDALLQGYDLSSANNYGLINATLELGVGKVLGGTTALLGKSPVSKLLGEKITSKLIVNPAINSAISDMASEFGEEYIQEWLDPKVKAYVLDKKDLAEAWDSSSFFDIQNFYAGLLGALSAGITNTPGTIRQNSALNSEFEKIVDTLQKDGNEKLTNEQLKQLKKTYYKEYNKALKNDTEIDYENISNKLTKENRTEQSLTNDIEQLKEQQKQTTDNKLKQELATKISGLEQELNQFKLPMASTEGMNLMESASKYNIKPETQSAVQQLMENRGIESRWDATKFSDNSVNALWTKDANGNRSVIFNPNASLDTIVEEVALHELTHDILSSENTTLNAQEVLDYVSQLDGYNKARQSLENTYSTMYDPNSADFKSLIDEEVVADVLGRKLGNQEFINQLVNSKPSVAKSIYNWVVNKLNSIVNKGKVRSEKLYWQNIKNNFENAYKQEYKNNEMASTKYKVSKQMLEKEFSKLTGDSKLQADAKMGRYAFQQIQKQNGNFDGEVEAPYSEEAMKLYKELENSKKTSSHLYHSTPIDRIQSIIKNGLQVGSKQNQEGVSSTNKLYLSATEELANSFTPEDSVMLRISPSANLENLDYDLLGGEGSYTITNNIEPKYLQVKENGKWVNLLKSKYANETKYSKENAEWNEFLDKNLKDTGTSGTLMAIHNLNEDKLKGILELGGFPYPSIAITKPSEISHEGYGDISVLFSKDTINPELSSKNKVYSRDAYTPRFPRIEYKLDSNTIKNIRKVVGDYDYRNVVVGDEYKSDANSIIDNLDDNINRSGLEKTMEDIKNSDAMKYIYLKNTNPDFKVETKNEVYSNKYDNNTLQRFIDNYDGKYDLNDIPSSEVEKYANQMVEAYRQQLEEQYKDNKLKDSLIEASLKNLKEQFYEKNNFLTAAYKLQKYGTEKQVLDRTATKEKMNNIINQEEYNKWVDNLFENIIEKKGLRNNKDYYTSSGNPRSFEQLHEDYTLDNVVKILDALDNTGTEGVFTGIGQIAGNASIRFNNIEDIKANENLLTTIGSEEYSQMLENIQNRLSNIDEAIMDRGHKNSDNYFIARDNLDTAISDAARLFGEGKKVDANKLTKMLNEYGFNPTLDEAQQIVDMFGELRQLPTQYFEAKPKRAVGLDEVEAIVIPNNTTEEFRKALKDAGLDFVEYDPSIEGDRQRVINKYDNLKFSKNSPEWDNFVNKHIPSEGTKTKLKDIKLPKKEINLPKSTQVKQETRQEVKLPTRETITKEELEELDSLKALNEITDLSREEQNRLNYLEKKQQGYTERYPGLKKVTDFKEISKEYGKYRDLDNFDRTLLGDAESMIKGYRNTERRTKDEWLSIARYIGSNFKGNSEELQKYAIQSWFAASPNQKGSLNRQGKGFVDFKIQEWINSMYDGARVGELDKPSTPKKQTILPMAREDNVLKVNANEIADFMNGINGNQRKWIGTSTESDVLKDKVLIKDLDASKLNYVVESNQKSVDTANNHLNTYGYEKSLEDVKSLLRSDKLPKASDVALAERVLQEAVRNGDTKTAQDLIMDIAILGTDLGQATQALSIIKRLTPEGQLSMYTKMIQRAKSRGEKSFENVEITPEMVEMVLNAYKSDGTYDQEDLNNRVENFKQEIANQMKTTAGEKINAWRYLAMLGNPKTHIRNIVSNVAMNGTIKVKNAMARTTEATISKLAPTLKKIPIFKTFNTELSKIADNRTKTWKKASNFIKNYAETTANEMKGIITGENKYNEKSSLESKKRTFKSNTLEKLSNFNSNALEAEDWFFSKRAFKSNLEEYLTANGINTQEDIESRPEVVEKAKNYAKEQAEIATFRQYSKLAAQINNLEKNNKLARFFIEATVPFKKTPINVAKAGVKYSPLGLIKSLSYDIYQVKQGNMEASQLIDNISQGLTGTSLTILGYALAKNGILNGGGDDDKEGKYDTQLGDNQYSLKIGDKSYSISWLSPVAMPLLVGANAFEQLEEKEEWDMNVVSETLAKTLDPLNEMSFMQGLTNALSSYDKGVEKLAGIGESVAQNYVGQFFPTIFSQFASTIDDKKRSTKASANSTYKFGEQTLRSIMYKLPGLRQQLEVATDVWGNEKEQADNIIQRAYESFLAPYSTTKNITTDLDKEIKSIYNKTNETGVIPSVPYSYIKYKDETYRMSANEYTKYKKTFGQNANKYLNNLISSNAYKNASDDDKAKMIKNTYDYAKAEANEEYFKSQSIDYTSDTLKELNALKKIGINDKSLSEYISNKTLASTIKSNSQLSANEKHQKIADNLIKSNLNDKQLAYLYGKYYSTDDKLNNLIELNIPIKEFIKLNSQDIESDYNERTGKTISNSKKNKVINYVNSLNLSIPQKAILIKSQYKTYKDYDNQIVNYVNNLNKSVNDKKVILKSIGFDNYDNDVINYINSQNMSIKDKEKKLKSLGFTIRDGRVYK